ncbi:flagellar basal-body MS-ring/collar protein FliF [Indioceanicola profundi]|uniref:flagellar basal-body MS-ring/collar protein FliF n=1 Tax=Indioceanicola profundi TaxID=2220096 RepID=UPI001CECF47C|nr:flagellar basal-body MS-ring/collar protein FliF [Indioceanicola profundi]
MANLLQTLRALGRQRLIILGVAAAAVLLAMALVAAGVSQPRMGLLYAGLDDAEAGRIVSQLQAMKVPHEVAASGTIQVPEAQIARTRMMLAQQGLPSAGGAGYELFDDQGALGLTSFMQRLNRVRALEGELGRTIQTLNGVKSARVHLSLPDPEAFSPQTQPASASVVVRTAGAGLDRGQALAVRHLVSAAVPGLASGAVTVMDTNGVVLAGDGQNDGVALVRAEEMRVSVEQRMARSIEQMLMPMFGPGNVRVQVAAEVDLGRETLREQTFDPNSRVARSVQMVEERENSTDRTLDQPTTVEQNLPLEDVNNASATARSESQREEETTNFEISSKLRERVQDAGEIRRLAVAVVVNGSYATGADGQSTYTPRTAEELRQVENVVRTAIGFSDSRGDMVTVENLRFLAEPAPEMTADVAAPTGLGPDWARLLQWAVAGIVALILLALVLRPLLQRRTEAAATPAQAADGTPQLTDARAETDAPQLTHAGGTALAAAGAAGEETTLERELEELIDLRSVDGGVSAAALKRLASIVDEHPEECITALRTWIYEGT